MLMSMNHMYGIIKALKDSEPENTNEFYRHYFIQWRVTVMNTSTELADRFEDFNKDWFLSHFDLSLERI